jgi:hypothetical protein
MLVRCAVLHVPLVARQHVVVSAPKMLLGSSVGFSYGRFVSLAIRQLLPAVRIW